MKKQQTRRRKPTYRPATIADRLLAAGQRLRADETVTPLSLCLRYAAQWTQAAPRTGKSDFAPAAGAR